ncbi:MAG: hypothetical protein JWP09_372 [Candidatus Taylorbacteria bacterium]|nr:hypothetical protein [Candidatus Taylorbacteria bacterium]
MKALTQNIFKKYKRVASLPGFHFSILGAVLFLGVSLCINFYAGIYATVSANNPVTDIILSNIPVYNVDAIFVYGAILLCVSIFFLCIINPEKIPFTVKTIALFVIVRSLFIILTHIGPYPNHTDLTLKLINDFSFDGDLFFSGHTGLPFLIALIYWDNKFLRRIYIMASIFFAIVVLLGHIHYSIDVFAAFFITEGTYRLSEKLFKKSYLLSRSTYF